MGILYHRLMIVLNESSVDSAYYFIALTMLKHIDGLSELAINELAALCAVSKSTISKFVRHLGYADYQEFRLAAVFQENKYNNYENHYNTNIMSYIEGNGFPSYLYAIHADLRATYKSLNWGAVDRLANDLADYDRVAAFGLMFSELAAMDLQTKLGYNKKFIITNMNDLKQDDFIRGSGTDTLLIVFSESGRFIGKYGSLIDDFAGNDAFDRTKAKVVLITTDKGHLKDPRVAYGIHFVHTGDVRTHGFVYPLINDIIVWRYRQVLKERESAR